MQPHPILTPAEVAERWKCSAGHVRRMIDNGELPAFRAGGKLLRIRIEDVEAYERQQDTLPSDIDAAATRAQKAADTRQAVVGLQAAIQQVRQRNRR